MVEKGKNRNYALDGFRALAIVLVILSHTGILEQGGFANGMFFCLSGFLASVPFRNDVEKTYLSFKKIMDYYLGRIIRIVPTHWLIITTVFLLTGSFFTSKLNFVENLFYIEGYMHLWFLQQQMWMYLCLPFIMILLALIKRLLKFRYNDILCSIVLFIMAILTYTYLTVDVFSLNGRGGPQQFKIGQFLIGISFGYLYKAYNNCKIDISKKVWGKIICEVLPVIFIAFSVISSEHVLRRINPDFTGYYIGWEVPMLCSVLSGIMIISLVMYPQGICARILSLRPIAYIGEISFIMYLVHMFLIRYLNFGDEIRNFLGVFLISACVAWVLQILIEKPSIIFAKTKSIKEVVSYYKSL